MSSSSPRRRSVPTTAATWPWGRLRVTSKASTSARSAGPSTASPFSTARSASTFSAGQCERLARVRFFTLPPSR